MKMIPNQKQKAVKIPDSKQAAQMIPGTPGAKAKIVPFIKHKAQSK